MEEITNAITVLKAVEVVMSLWLIPVTIAIINLLNGMKCQLRSDMLHIYYEHKDDKRIRQYELENFIYLYKAYKALRGNSFIDKINKEVLSWEVIE